MPKNLGTGSHIETPEGEPDLVGPGDTTEEPVPATGGSQEHGKGSDSLSVVITYVDDDGEPATPSEPVKAPSSKASARVAPAKPGSKAKSDN